MAWRIAAVKWSLLGACGALESLVIALFAAVRWALAA